MLVARLAVGAGEQPLASISDDRTLRLWTLPKGTPWRVIRPPIGINGNGEPYAVSLNPDGGRAGRSDGLHLPVVGTGSSAFIFTMPDAGGCWRGSPACQAGAASRLLGGWAAALGGKAGIRVFDARNGQLLVNDPGYGGPARMLGFSRNGRLATAAADGHVRVYDANGRKPADRVSVAGARPYRGRTQNTERAAFQQAYRALHAQRRAAAHRGRPGADAAAPGAARRGAGAHRAPAGAGAGEYVVVAGRLPLGWDARALPEGTTALRLSFAATDWGPGFGPPDVLVNHRSSCSPSA